MHIIPAPRSVSRNAGSVVVIDQTSSLAVRDDALVSVADWLRSELERLTSISMSDHGGGGSVISLQIDPSLTSDLETHGTSPSGEALDHERYTITVIGNAIHVTGASAEGVFRGATTLVHLIALNSTGASATLESMEIKDAPRFGWRGLSFDVVRTFHPVETVRKVIDLLALYKMNVLHLHLTDTEGWRFEVPTYPELTGISGATARNDRAGGSYSPEDYAEILNYAAERFVTVVPEFDSPGHTASVLRAYPALATDDILAMPEAMHYLNPDIPGVWDLVDAVYSRMAEVHPGPWLHIGGDEAIAMDEDTFGRYMSKAMPLARSTGKGIVAWQESARAGFEAGDLMQYWIPPHLVQRVRDALDDPENSWLETGFPDPTVREAFVQLFLQAPADLPKALQQGARIIISRADKLYLDTKYPEASSDPTQHADHERVGMSQAVYGSGTVQDSYTWDPEDLEEVLTVDHMAGIEAAIWCETIEDEQDLMFQLLPRLPGVAEKGWSDNRDWDDYRPRLAAQRRMWDALGVNYFVSSVVWPKS